jgi:hypothetical protein
MKRLVHVCLVVCCSGVPARAGPTESAIMAAMRLSDQPNYSWVATISDDARTYDIAGKTVRGGFTRVKMPIINSVRRQLGRSVTDTDVDIIFHGNVACVIQTENGWRKPDELSTYDSGDPESPHLPGATGHAPLLGARPTAGGAIRGSIIRAPTTASSRNTVERAYSNLQPGISHPHEELAVIVGSHQVLTVEGDVVTGALTDLGAQLLLVHDGQVSITPLRASGTFKLWLRNDIVVKYQVRLEGVLNIHLPARSREVTVHQVTDTVLKDIGTTTFEVPPQARAKLGI